MRALRDISLSRKLMLIIMATSMAALLCACVAIVIHDRISVREAMARDLATQADVLGANSTAALTFGDVRTAEEMLSSLKHKPHIVAACIYTKEGKPFATYVRSGTTFTIPAARIVASYFTADRLVQFRPISLDNETVGSLYIESDLEEMREHLRSYSGILILVVLGSSLLAYLLGSRLQELISRPVFELVNTARRVSSEKNYGLRAARHGEDELGLLVNEFNGMLTQIEARDEELERKRADLQNEVEARTATNAQLEVAKNAAESANRAKSEFLANMSHEIRTPLNGILGMTELTLGTDLNPEQQEYLLAVQQSAESLLTVIGDILDFSKIEARKLDFDSVEFSIRETVEDALKAVALSAHRKQLELACDVAVDVPCRVIGDPSRLRQIIINLAGNAIKFTEKGEVIVRVRCDTVDDKEAHLHFAITDTGIGIPLEKQGLIFGAFTQSDSSTRRRFGGTGLGLAISSALVARMGGRIWLNSVVGKGSTFHFTVLLPLALDQEQESRVAPIQLRNLPALIVDDNATNRRILQEMLHNWQMAPHNVAGGRAALELLRVAKEKGNPFALVLTDGRMPDIDGFELATRIKNDPRLAKTAILMLTSDKQQGDGERCRELGMSAYLVKPVRQSELLAAILNCLESHEAEKAAPSSASAVWKNSRSLRLLLAEDNPVNQKFAVKMLEKSGHSVIIANNGREALAVLEASRFDLILMDIQMPEMDGFEVTAAIREQEKESGKHIPIVAMTAHAMTGDRERCLAAGMDGYVSKPIRLRELVEAIEQQINPRTSSSTHSSPELLERVGGDQDLLRELAETFLDNYPKLIDSLRTLIRENNAAALMRTAHELRGAVGVFGSGQAMELARRLEKMGRERDLDKGNSTLVALENSIEELKVVLIGICKLEAGGGVTKVRSKSAGMS